MRILVQKDKQDIEASEDEKYAFVIEIAKGKVDTKMIKEWIEQRLC